MFVYKITNQANGKVYIGQSIRPVEQRFKRHISDAINNILDTHFARAIRKWGKENFTVEVIDKADSQDELNIKEQFWIRQYQSTDSTKGYNETDAIYKCGGNTYQSKSEAEMDDISAKISASKVGSLNPASVKVKCLDILSGEEIVFDTVRQCQEYFGENTHRFITTRITEETRGLYQERWAIAYYDHDYKYDLVVHKTGRGVFVTNMESGDAETVPSIRLFCREYNINRSRITDRIKAGCKDFILDDKWHVIILD